VQGPGGTAEKWSDRLSDRYRCRHRQLVFIRVVSTHTPARRREESTDKNWNTIEIHRKVKLFYCEERACLQFSLDERLDDSFYRYRVFDEFDIFLISNDPRVGLNENLPR
jgi:hypothetical protein